MKRLRLKEKLFMVSPMRGVRRSGPCIMGGVSPSLYHAWQSVTGPVFTGLALPPVWILQFGFLEPGTQWDAPLRVDRSSPRFDEGMPADAPLPASICRGLQPGGAP